LTAFEIVAQFGDTRIDRGGVFLDLLQHGDDVFHGDGVGLLQKCVMMLLIGINLYHWYFPLLINLQT
jgi:hypothetical protein